MKRIAVGAVVILAGLALGCENPNDVAGPASPYASAAQYSRDHSGMAMLVLQGSQIVYEDSENGGSPDQPYQLFSGTKSFNCALASAAIADGYLTSFDELVSNTITEWSSDAVRSTITVRQLLNFTSGLSQKLLNLTFFAEGDYRFSAALPSVATPGTTFAYGESSLAVFEELMRRKLASTGMDPLAYLKAKVLDPIGLSYSFWLRNGVGQPFLSFGASISARQWIKYGQLLRDNGVWNGTTILSSASLTQCKTGSTPNAGYGLNLWLNAAMPSGFTGFKLSEYASPSFPGGGPTGLIYPGGPSTLFALAGVGDNRMYIIPSQNLVIVRMGRGSLLSNWDDAQFLRLFFGQ